MSRGPSCVAANKPKTKKTAPDRICDPRTGETCDQKKTAKAKSTEEDPRATRGLVSIFLLVFGHFLQEFLVFCKKNYAKFRFFLRAKHVFFESRYCAAVLFSQVPQKCTDLDLSLLYILVSGTYHHSKFSGKNNFLAPGVCFPQPCSSAGRRFAASRSRLQNYRRFVSFSQPKNRWNVL